MVSEDRALCDSRAEITGLSLMHKGKVRDTYALPEFSDLMLIVATDRISAFDVVLPDGIPGKGVVLNKMTIFWLRYLQNLCMHHLVTDDVRAYPPSCDQFRHVLHGRSMIVRRYRVIPFECIVRGHLTGSFFNDFTKTVPHNGKTESPLVGRSYKVIHGYEMPAHMMESQKFMRPIFTPSTKAAAGAHDENISMDHMHEAMNAWLRDEQLDHVTHAAKVCKELSEKSIALYKAAYKYASECGIIIADTKFEYGMTGNGEIVLIDEVLTPDSSRFWPKDEVEIGASPSSYDKQFVRNWLKENWRDRTHKPPHLPEEIIHITKRRYDIARKMLVK